MQGQHFHPYQPPRPAGYQKIYTFPDPNLPLRESRPQYYQEGQSYEPVHSVPGDQNQPQLIPQQQAYRPSPPCPKCGGIRHTAKTCPITIRAQKDTIVRLSDQLAAVIAQPEIQAAVKNTLFATYLEALLECHAHRCYHHESKLLTPKKNSEQAHTAAETKSHERIG